MSKHKSHSFMNEIYKKKLRQNIFTSIAANLRSNITIALGNLNIIEENRDEKTNFEALKDIKCALNYLEALSSQIDGLSSSAMPDFVPGNVDLVKILNVVTQNLKFLAAQKEIDIFFTGVYDKYLTYISPLMIDRLAGHLISMLIRSSLPSSIIRVILQQKDNKHGQLCVIFSPCYDIVRKDSEITHYDLLTSLSGNLLDACLYESLCETFDIDTSIIQEGDSLKVLIPMPPMSEDEKEDDFLINYNLWSTFRIYENQSPAQDGTATSFDDDPNKQIILIIEDNQEVGRFLSKTLQDEYRVIQAFNGFDGLRKAVNLIPDLILSDIHMPGVNGIDLTRLIKNDEKTSHIPVALITADAYEANKIIAIEAGADEILIKPVSLKELKARISAIFSNRAKLLRSVLSGTPNKEEMGAIAEDKFLAKLNEILDQNFSEEDFSVEDLSDLVGMSQRQLQRKIKAVTGRNPNGYIRYFRLKKAKYMIVKQKVSVSEAAYASGFSNLSYFAKCYKEQFGELPSDSV
ncbi:MAG: response regulator [Ignavibacteriaceae bacterium]|nr:MAG: response regulator [Ignavibacteriaceae bacterium]